MSSGASVTCGHRTRPLGQRPQSGARTGPAACRRPPPLALLATSFTSMPQRQASCVEPLCLLWQCSIAWRLWSLHLGNQLQCASMLSAMINGFWRMEHNTSCSTGIESVPVALVGLAIKLWQYKCQSPAEPLSLLGLGFQLWKHLMQPAGPLEASKSSCCTAQPIGLHNERPQILHPAVHSASVGQHHIYDLVQNVAGICAVPLPGTLCA